MNQDFRGFVPSFADPTSSPLIDIQETFLIIGYTE